MRERGHCKGDLKTSDGRVCVYGALGVAAAEMFSFQVAADMEMDLWELADLSIATFDPASRYGFACNWNDESDRTQIEVEKFLLHCADRADFGGTA